MRQAITATISKMTPTAAATETMKSCGGVFLISATAFFATSRGCTFGFSGAAFLNTAACTASTCAVSVAGGGGGGGMYTVLSGGNSSISEKLRLAAAPTGGFPDIIGSTLIFGASVSGSMIVAEDMVGEGVADASAGKFFDALEELMTGAALSILGTLSPFANFAVALAAPAAAAAALTGVGGSVTGDETLVTCAIGLAGFAVDVAGVRVDFAGELSGGVAARLA